MLACFKIHSLVGKGVRSGCDGVLIRGSGCEISNHAGAVGCLKGPPFCAGLEICVLYEAAEVSSNMSGLRTFCFRLRLRWSVLVSLLNALQ